MAALGHPYGPNEERGIFRSTDGGQTFQKVLYKDENTGGNDVDIDPSNPSIVYSTLWEERQGPWENAVWAGTNGGIFKSTDGGTSWTQLTKGLPTVVQANMAISPANPKRIYAIIAAYDAPGTSANRGTSGIYRSDDAGESWVQISTDTRPAGRIGGGDLPMPIPHPKDADTVIVASTVSWKSTDGGKTWVPFKGAPGGEDYQNGWINPDNPEIVMLAADQGAVISLNGGETWSNWYNQPTAALYHVAADNAFPYRLCSGQQESGSVCIASRGNYGAISERDWLPVGVDEYGYVAPDPLDPDVVYGGRTVTRFDRRTGQTSGVGPVAGRGGVGGATGNFRQVRTMPVVFSEVDRKSLFFANNILWKTIDGGKNWKAISKDLTRATYESPKAIGKYANQESAQPAQRGVIYTVAPSYKDIARIWAGTDDGLIHTTADGGLTWKDVTPPALTAWAKVSIIDAGRFDPLTAYAAINTLRLDDLRPHIYKTHDAGRTWTEIVDGIPAGETVNAVREDPKKKGLLFAATERTVYVSLDDGARWRSLRLNLPVSSVRDVIVKDDDLVIATHGRGFWILDDITPLRQLEAETPADTTLFTPTTAWRVRWNTSSDMPWPKEEPTGQNPPDGAIVNYYLKGAASGPVTLEILQQDGRVIRRYSSADPVPPIPDPPSAPWPVYWYRPAVTLSTTAGMHRFLWDVHLQPLGPGAAAGAGLGAVPTQLPIQAIPDNSPTAATTPWAAPGTYTAKLTVDGRSYTQPIVVKQDPRVRTPALEMRRVYTLTNALYFGAADAQAAAIELGALRERIANQAQGSEAAAQALADFGSKAAALEGTRPTAGGGRGGRGGRGARGAAPADQPAAAAPGRGVALAPGGGLGASPAASTDTLWSTTATLSGMMNAMQAADVSPTTNTLTAVTAAQASAAKVMARWRALKTIDLPALNLKLEAAGAQPLTPK